MDIPSVLRSFNENNVCYVVIGSVAFLAHDYARATLDFDILIQPTRENARRALKALAEAGYDPMDLTVAKLLAKKTLFRGYPLRTDVHPSAKGVSFDEVWEHREAVTFEGVPTNVASLDDMIRMKKAAHRPKDLIDLKVLRRIRARRETAKNGTKGHNRHDLR